MSNNTLKSFGQSLMSKKQDKLNNFLESSGVEELDDAASVAVNGGSIIWGGADNSIIWGGADNPVKII